MKGDKVILYHLDRSGKLHTGQMLDLSLQNISPDIKNTNFITANFPKGVSRQGENYISADCLHIRGTNFCSCEIGPCISESDVIKALDYANERIIELTFELVRESLFPNLPSRFTSLFAVDAISEFDKWEYEFGKIEKKDIYEIEVPDSTRSFDSNYLKGGISFIKESTDRNFIGTCTPFIYDMALQYWGGNHTENSRNEYLIQMPVKIGKKVKP